MSIIPQGARGIPLFGWSLGAAGAGSLLVCAMPGVTLADEPWGIAQQRPFVLQEAALSGDVNTLRSPSTMMVRVPTSSFYMGSTELEAASASAACLGGGGALASAQTGSLVGNCQEQAFSAELPRHRVRLPTFWLDSTEVTWDSYRRCVELRRCEAPPYHSGSERFARRALPVSLVTFPDAERYCRFRGARLPSETEFERAARGVAGRRYPWGDLYHSRAANHGRVGWDATDDQDGFAELAPVGSYPSGRTPDGLLDLAGNVSEWVQDLYAPSYTRQLAGMAGATLRVVRGGDYLSPAPFLRGAARRAAEPSVREPFVGFRCARSVPRRPTRG